MRLYTVVKTVRTTSVSATFLRPSQWATALELGHGRSSCSADLDLVETGPHSPLATLMKVSPAPMGVR